MQYPGRKNPPTVAQIKLFKNLTSNFSIVVGVCGVYLHLDRLKDMEGYKKMPRAIQILRGGGGVIFFKLMRVV